MHCKMGISRSASTVSCHLVEACFSQLYADINSLLVIKHLTFNEGFYSKHFVLLFECR